MSIIKNELKKGKQKCPLLTRLLRVLGISLC
jgi:hypothetical protein